MRRLVLLTTFLLATTGGTHTGLAAGATAHGAPTLSGLVWTDTNRDGVRGRGEPVRRGVTVELQRKRGSRFVRAARTVSKARGVWSFTIPRAGTYRAKLLLPPGVQGVSPQGRGRNRTTDSDFAPSLASAAFTFRRGGRSRTVDAGLLLTRSVFSQTPPSVAAASTGPPLASPATVPQVLPSAPTTATVGDLVWRDANTNGRHDAGEPGLAGVAVELWDGTRTLKLAETVTDASGAFALTASLGATYRLRVLLPSGAVFAPTTIGEPTGDSDIHRTGADTGFSAALTLNADTEALDAGIVFPATTQLGNFVFRDVDGNGDQDATDPGQSGISVQLWNESRTQLLASTTSGAGGGYALQAPRGANYIVHFGTAPGYPSRSPKDATGNEATDSDPQPTGALAGDTALITVGAATPTISTLDAGYHHLVSVGNRVWDDTDGDGVQDNGEPGLSNVTVQLWSVAKDKIYAQTTTSPTGTYVLLAPGAKGYRIRAVLPSGAAFSPKDVGNENTDSDVNPTGVNLGFTDTYTFDADLLSITSIDVGMILP